MEAYVFYDDSEFKQLAELCRSSPNLFRQACRAAIKRAGQGLRQNIRSGIRAQSFLSGKPLSSAISRLKFSEGGMEAGILVSSKPMPAHEFRLMPLRVTARKGKRSSSWPEPQYQLGPGLAPRRASRSNGGSRGFIFRGKNSGKLVLGQRLGEGRGKVKTVYGVATQYFAVFDEVKDPAMRNAGQTFMKRLEHEIDYRMGALR